MAEPDGRDRAAVQPPEPDDQTSYSDPAFDDLRRLLVGQEREQLAAILDHLHDADARRREVGDVLPQVLLEHAADPRFTHALTPPVERAITASVSRNPGPLADALFPVMGPAIRKAVAASLAAMVESLNRTLEQRLSWRAVVWRLEALRTGKSFGEIMLLHTLVYRVEQVFLIERTSGLLLQHVREGASEVRDVDMVSGMLTAIRDFVQDSFRVADTDGLEALKVGELSVWIEQGPHAVIAAVIRGVAPRTFRSTLQSAIERIHVEFADEFARFKGDIGPFESGRPILDGLLHSEFSATEAPSHRPIWIAAAVALVVLLIWIGFSIRARQRWNHYLDALGAEPGIVVVSTGRASGRFAVSGLRDPLARNPEALLGASGLTPADVTARWSAYYAPDAPLAAARARQVLQPPAGVSLHLENGVLSINGPAPLPWLADAGRLAPLIPGVSRLDASAAIDALARAQITEMESRTPLFVKGQAALARGQDVVLQQIVDSANRLRAAAVQAGRRFRIDVVGHADADGAVEANLPLSRARAAFVASTLTAAVGDRFDVISTGVGSDNPFGSSPDESDKQKNRCVTVRVTPIDPVDAKDIRP